MRTHTHTHTRTLTQLGLVFTVMSLTTSAMAATYIAADKSPETQICVSSATDNRMRFENRVETSGFRMKVVADKLNCNGAPIQSFSALAGNTELSNWLSHRYNRTGRIEIHVGAAATTGSAVTTLALTKADDRIIYVRGK